MALRHFLTPEAKVRLPNVDEVLNLGYAVHVADDPASGEEARSLARRVSWIYGSREHDRHGTRRLEQRPQGRGTVGQHDVGRERGQFRRVSGNFGGFGRGPADVDAHVAADGPAQHFASACRNAPTQA